MDKSGNIESIKFVRTKEAGKAPTTANLQEGELAMNLADKTLYGANGTSIFRFGDPDRLMKYDVLAPQTALIKNVGSIYTASATGALVVGLPTAKFNSTTMLKVTIKGYDYTANSSWELTLSGYNFTGAVWHNCSAVFTGSTEAPFIKGLTPDEARRCIKFAHTTTQNIFVIGDATTKWTYPNIVITDVQLGHLNVNNGGWDTGWTLNFVSDQTVLDGYKYAVSSGTPFLMGDINALSANKLNPEELTSGDLNNYTTPGLYRCRQNNQAALIANTPINYAFSLLVEKAAGTKQTFTAFNDNRTWVRNQTTEDTATTKAPWTQWREVAYTDSASSGNAATATKWATPTTFTFTGDTTGTVTFDGSETTKSIPLTTRAASTTVAGIVQLANVTNSTSTTQALTANMGKTLADAINTKVDKINPTSSGTFTHTGNATVTSGNFTSTGNISTNSNIILNAAGSKITKSDGANIGFYDGTASAAIGINVGNLLVSNQYADMTKVPTNGAYIKGSISTDNVISGASATGYASLTAVGRGVTAPFLLKETTTATLGFVPAINFNTKTAGGYLQVNTIGTYRPAANFADSGVYIATGNNDGYSTEAFLFKNGRTIESTAGELIVKGNSSTATNINAYDGSLVGDGTVGWRKLGTATMPISGRNMRIDIYGGAGFNSGQYDQQMLGTINLKSDNAASSGTITMTVHVPDKNLILTDACWVYTGGTEYDIYIQCGGYYRASMTVFKGALTEWTRGWEPAATATKPANAGNARIYTLALRGESSVGSADRLNTPRNINDVPFDGTANINIQQKSIIIPANADLNDYLNEGFYYQSSSANAATIKNRPLSIAFSLLVEKTAGVKQTFTAYEPANPRTFVRTIYSGTVGEWKEVLYGNTNVFELGQLSAVASPVYLDFHSGSTPTVSFDSRIVATGGSGSDGNGSLTYIANAGHMFTGNISLSNTSATVQQGISLFGATTNSGKPRYGFMMAGTGNAGLGTHGGVTSSWATYFTHDTGSASEARGWIFQRTLDSVNVASISTLGLATFNSDVNSGGNINTTSDNSMINVGNNSDLALVKKAGGNAFVGVGLNNPFRISKSNTNTVDPSNTFTELFTVSSAGVANAVGGFNGTFTGTLNGNATTATQLATARTISMTGDGTWTSTAFNGAANVTGVMTLSNSGVTAGTYKSVTVDAKGRVTAGATVITGLVTAATAAGTANAVTGNTNTYLNIIENVGGSVSSVGSSTQVTGAGTVTVTSDAAGKLTITGNQNISGNAATATKWATARTITFTGDTTGTATFDGSGNVTSTLTTRTASTSQTGIVQLYDGIDSVSTTLALTANQGRIIGNKVNYMAQVAMYDETSGHQGLGDNPTFTNVYGYPITVLFSVSYNSGSNPPYGITISNADGTLSFAAPGNVPIQVPAGHKYQLIHVGGGGRNNIHQVIIIR